MRHHVTARQPSIASVNAFNILAYILMGVIFLFTTYKHFELDAGDPYKCGALMKQGQWLDAPQNNGSKSPYKSWQTPGCMIHQYNPAEIARCVENRNIIFVGDSTVRQIYWATVRKLNKTEARVLESRAKKHDDQKCAFGGVSLEFLWDPYLNSSRLRKELYTYQESRSRRIPQNPSAALMVIGSGAWFARYFDSEESFPNFQAALNNVTEYTQSKIPLSSSLENPGPSGIGDQVFLTPIQPPIYDQLEGLRKDNIIEGEIEIMNAYLWGMERANNILWSYLAMTGQQDDALELAGLHVRESVADAKADVLLNLRCNAVLDQNGGYPFDRTCCSNYKPTIWTQRALVAASIALAIVVLWRVFTSQENTTGNATLFFAATLAYCYAADRTALFEKVQKHFVKDEFLLLCAIYLMVGILSFRWSGKPNIDGTTKDQPFCSRDQTEEWKGWMQFAILIYHWTGASSTLWIYQLIRLLVASYLFLTGFGHTCYFLKKGDYSFRRVGGVLVRLNLLSCALPYVMGTDYLFYYFAPLVTFWFMVVYVTMCVCASRNDNTGFVIMKIAFAAALITVILETRFFDTIFDVLKSGFRISWDVREWKFRLGLDRYIVFIGMLVALCFDRYISAIAAGSSARLFTYLRIPAIILSVIALPAVLVLLQRFESKPESNELHPFLSPIAILAFITLRNAFSRFRNFHSTFFAWLGTFSLETFILQYHIWLAGDTKGLLSLGLFHGDGSLLHDRWRDFAIVTPVFFWVSSRLAVATGTITQFILDEDAENSEESEGLLEARALKEMELSERMKITKRLKFVIWPRDLRLRLCILLVGMWTLNLTW